MVMLLIVRGAHEAHLLNAQSCAFGKAGEGVGGPPRAQRQHASRSEGERLAHAALFTSQQLAVLGWAHLQVEGPQGLGAAGLTQVQTWQL